MQYIMVSVRCRLSHVRRWGYYVGPPPLPSQPKLPFLVLVAWFCLFGPNTDPLTEVLPEARAKLNPHSKLPDGLLRYYGCLYTSYMIIQVQ